jgi:adenylate kinase
MQCGNCKYFERRNAWKCRQCGRVLDDGVVFVTGISGSGVEEYMREVITEATGPKHGHVVALHDVGALMKEFAKDDDPDVLWDRILDADEKLLRQLRARALQRLAYDIKSRPDALHLVDLHLSFRWYAYLTLGFQPHILEEFKPQVRSFINIVEDLPKVQERLGHTSWGKREILELLVWRDEELFLTDLFADVCGRVDRFAVARGEPASLVERLIWHPELRRVYLSFPITNIQADPEARGEIQRFRDGIREFLIVFDPYACRDYDETYERSEMKALRKQVGEATVDRDYRFIDQADAVVVYFPKKVASKGVDAEMNHARRSGKQIFLYSPEDPGGGPFAVPPHHFRTDPDEFIQMLREELQPRELPG